MIIKGLPDILKDEPKLSEFIIEYTEKQVIQLRFNNHAAVNLQQNHLRGLCGSKIAKKYVMWEYF